MPLCAVYADGAAGENEFLYNKLNDFRVDNDHGKKPKFDYRLPGIGLVCREAWILAAGFPNRNNSRVRMLEARIRQGKPLLMHASKKSTATLNSTTYTLAFLQDYILNNSQRSPVTTELYVIWLRLFVHQTVWYALSDDFIIYNTSNIVYPAGMLSFRV